MFEQIPPSYYLALTTVGAVFMGAMGIFIRSRSAKKPASAKKILLPPLFMSTGAFMFVFPFFRVAPPQVAEALAAGIVFSVVLIWSSKFEEREGAIYLKQSKAFIFILIGLLLIRLLAKVILSATIDIGELAGMFWILAFGMIIPWRLAMYLQFKKLTEKNKSAAPG